MAKQKQSTAEIIKLGKTLVEELGLIGSFDTLSKWMAFYLAELIHKIESSPSIKEKSKLEKECCKIILNLWDKKENLHPDLQPLGNLKETLGILNSIRKKETSIWGSARIAIDGNPWNNFVDKVNENSQKIIEISILFSLTNTDFSKTKKWTEKHSAMLTKEEKDVLEILDSLLNEYNNFFSPDPKNSIVDMEPAKRKKFVLGRLKKLIDNQMIALKLLSQKGSEEEIL